MSIKHFKITQHKFLFSFLRCLPGYFLVCYEYRLKSLIEKGLINLQNFSLEKKLGVFGLKMGGKIFYECEGKP